MRSNGFDGFDYDQPGTKKEDTQKVVDDWTVEMPGKLAADGMTDVQTKNSIIAWLKYILVDGGAYVGQHVYGMVETP